MTFSEEGLVLGAGTVLAKTRSDAPGAPALAVESAEERILALLAVAYGEPVSPGVLGNIRRAAEHWSRGERLLALIHSARSRLPRLPDEQASFRLFLADGLLADGASPRELMKACGIDTAPLDLLKAGFNPDELRVPAGNPDGGQWSYGDGSAEGAGLAPSARPRGQPSGAGRADTVRPSTTLHGYATVYDPRLAETLTASGDAYDPTKMTAAVLPGTIPLGSVVTVTLDSHPRRAIDVYANDHGLYRLVQNPDGSVTREPLRGRVIDLSTAAFEALTRTSSGKVMVTVTIKSGPSK